MTKPTLKGPLVLAILDGWGISRLQKGNAIQMARTPVMGALTSRYPVASLQASGKAVGLPPGQMGNSEVGHLNIGAGRIVYQELVRISKSIKKGNFFDNTVLLEALKHVRQKDSALHLVGLLSDGGVHSHYEHLQALLYLAHSFGLKKVFVHAVLDGRDVPPSSARQYLLNLEKYMQQLGTGKVATLAGRYYAMDRDKRWDRTRLAYEAYVRGKGPTSGSALEALEESYRRGETDEFVLPTVIMDKEKPAANICPNDAVIFYNFRADRMRQLLYSFYEENFHEFDRGDTFPLPYLATMTMYDERLNIPAAFPSSLIEGSLGEVLSLEKSRQLRIAETEKYAHVTYFFNGGREKPFPGEERILIPSPQVATYDLQPEMSAFLVTERVVREIRKNIFQLVVLNFANTDMVGHTGVIPAAVKAVETVDTCLGKVISAVKEMGGVFIVTSDHGNAEQMLDEDGGAHTAHTSCPVPFILGCRRPFSLRKDGILADIAPTILQLLQVNKPDAMTGQSLLTEAGGSTPPAIFSPGAASRRT